MPRSWRRNASIKLAYQSPVPAPVAKGDRLGRLTVSGQGVPAMDVPLYAGADIPKLGLPGRAMAVVSRMFTGGGG